MPRLRAIALIAGVLVLCAGMSAHAQKKYGPGVTDTEIKLGQTMPYSGLSLGYRPWAKLRLRISR